MTRKRDMFHVTLRFAYLKIILKNLNANVLVPRMRSDTLYTLASWYTLTLVARKNVEK